MSKARRQSIKRAIARGNAIYYYNRVIQTMDVLWKKGTPAVVWAYNLRNQFAPDKFDK